MPTVGTLDNPSSGLLASDWASQYRFATAANVRLDVAVSGFPFWLLVVVALVEADVLRPSWSPGSTKRDGVERLAGHVLVVNIGTRERHGQRDSLAVGQDMALGPELCTIGRVGTGEVPPFGALMLALSSDVHSQSMPTCWS